MRPADGPQFSRGHDSTSDVGSAIDPKPTGFGSQIEPFAVAENKGSQARAGLTVLERTWLLEGRRPSFVRSRLLFGLRRRYSEAASGVSETPPSHVGPIVRTHDPGDNMESPTGETN